MGEDAAVRFLDALRDARAARRELEEHQVFRPRRVQLVVEDEVRTVHTRAGAVQPIYDKAGNEVARLKTTLFGHQLLDLREGAHVRLGR